MPPEVDQNGYGLRVPGSDQPLREGQGHIDHQQLSHDAYLKFIEDDFLEGSRLDPATDGRPDARPDVREKRPASATSPTTSTSARSRRSRTALAPSAAGPGVAAARLPA